MMTDDKFLLALWNVCKSAKLVETGRTFDDIRHAFDRYISDGEDSDSAMKAALGKADVDMSVSSLAKELEGLSTALSAQKSEIEYGFHDGRVKNVS